MITQGKTAIFDEEQLGFKISMIFGGSLSKCFCYDASAMSKKFSIIY